MKVGDHVLVPFNIACGSCLFCKQGLYGNCHESNSQATAVGGIFGYSHTAGGYNGGQAEYVRVPYANFGPTVIPAGMDLDDAVMLTDVAPTGYQAAEMAGIQPGDTVVVFGAGPVGIMAARCCWLFGAGRVIIIDQYDYRLEFAKNSPSAKPTTSRKWTTRWSSSRKPPTGWAPMRASTPWAPKRPAMPCKPSPAAKLLLQAGSATALHWAINSVKKGGIVSIVGVYGPTDNLVPIGNVVNKGITIRANQASVKRHLPRLIEHVQNGVLNPEG